MRSKILLGVILLSYVAITLAYGVINPLFESPDEHSHYFTAQYIADRRELPVVAETPDDWLGQEAAQPPLYYLIGAALIAPINTDGAQEQVWLNPFAWIGDASALANVNWVVHTPAEDWPWQGFALAAHLLRLFSTVLGLGTLLCIYAGGRLIWPDDRVKPLLATALAAFLPQFDFVHASITNDALIIFLCSLALLQLIRFWQVGDFSAPRLLLLGLTVGLAALSKNAGILLLIYSLGFLWLAAIRDRRGDLAWRSLALVGLPAIVIAGRLWLRNWRLYGDPTATNQFISLAGGDRNYSLWQVLGESDGLLRSLAAVFGWFNVQPPNWVYWVWGGIAVLAILGGAGCLRLRSRRPRSGDWPTFHALVQAGWFIGLLLAGWVALVYAGLLSFMVRTEAAQGRLLLPAVLPLALGVAWGLIGSGSCAGRGLQSLLRRLAPVLAALALATTVYSLLFVIRPAYALPQSVATLPEDIRPVLPELIDRGQGLSLLGARVETPVAQPGDIVWLTLYWRAERIPETAPEFVLELFGRDAALIANLHSYHGRGLYPANLWQAGNVVADRFAIRLDENAGTPVLGRIFARLADGNPGIEVATVKVVPQRWPVSPETTLAELGDNIALAGVAIAPETVRPGETVTVSVRWHAPRGNPERDYTTLVHLGQPDRTPLVTGDRPPLGGDYPTSAWQNGETFDDTYTLPIPVGLSDGRYPIWIGMYDTLTGERLPVTINGQRQPNDVYLAGWVNVSACEDGAAACDP